MTKDEIKHTLAIIMKHIELEDDYSDETMDAQASLVDMYLMKDAN